MAEKSLVERLQEAAQGNAYSRYGNVFPVAQDVSPMKEAGKPRPAMPNVVRGPLQSLLRILRTFENPGSVTEDIGPDVINLFLAGKAGTAAKGVQLPKRMGFPIKDRAKFVEFLAALRIANGDRNALGYGEALQNTMAGLSAKYFPRQPDAPKGINIPIKPPTSVNMKIEPPPQAGKKNGPGN